MREVNTEQKICLTIAGLDPSGGAGIIADTKAFFANGAFGTAAITSITYQNTQGVFGAEHQTAQSVRQQIEPILDDFNIFAVKTGMLPTREIIEEIALIVKEYKLKNFVVDPVVRSTSGFDLIDDLALKSLIKKLFPLSDLITPNIPEAERISATQIKTEQDIIDAAKIMNEFGAKNVLIKGGHLEEASIGENPKAIDYLFTEGKLEKFECEYLQTTATHGTGCALASAITANLAKGNRLNESVKFAKEFVHEAIKNAPNIGKGNSPIGV